jgi:hypothetical protein
VKSLKKSAFKWKLAITIIPFLIGVLVISPDVNMLDNDNQIKPDNNGPNTSQDALFDGLYLNYTFSITGYGSGFSNFLYTHISGDFYYIYWDMFIGDSTWEEEKDTRVIYNSTGSYAFGDGNHAPLWVFTNTTLYEIIPIAIDGTGSHAFNVTGLYEYNLPGFGIIDVWYLEDLTYPGGIAWFERTTGFLVKGFFPINPTVNYTFDLLSTNLFINSTISDTGIYNGLHVGYNYSAGAMTLPSNISFSVDSTGIYNVTWDVFLLGTISWSEYLGNRSIFNKQPPSSGFNLYSHTPIWIHTDVLFNDIVPITVDGVGDHSFQITGQIVHNLIGYGWVEIWILQDLANASSIVWYEKSTGLLIQGTFIYGVNNYTMTFLDTNAIFTYVNPPSSGGIPGYNHLLFIGFLIGVSLILIQIKKRR